METLISLKDITLDFYGYSILSFVVDQLVAEGATRSRIQGYKPSFSL